MMLWAVDPGRTTGNRLLSVNAVEPGILARPYRTADYKTVVQQSPMEFLTRAEEFIADCDARGGDPLHFQIESFTITAATAKKGAEHDALHIIGTLLYFCHKYANWCTGNVTFGFTKPASVMRLFPDPVLKSLGLHTPGKPHGNDAARHGAFWLLDNGYIGLDEMRPS